MPKLKIATFSPALLDDAEAEAALTADPPLEEGAAVTDAPAEADPVLEVTIDEPEPELAEPDLELDCEAEVEFDEDMVLDTEADELDADEEDATPVTAARLAVPPPMVETGVHWEVAPAAWAAGVDASPWEKVDPP